MRDDAGVAGRARHLDGRQGFAERADLVELDQDRIAGVLADAAFQALGIGHEEVVADQLHARAQLARQRLPSRPIVLGQSVLDRDDRIAVDPVAVQAHHLFRVARLFVRAREDVAAVLVEFAGGRVERERDVVAGPVAGLGDRFEDHLDRFLVVTQVGSEAALVADVGRLPALFQYAGQRVKDLGAHANRVGERRRAERHDHELLHVDAGVGVLAAVEHVHHRHRQHAGVRVEIAVERYAWPPRRRRGRLRATRRASRWRRAADLFSVPSSSISRSSSARLRGRVGAAQRRGDKAVDVGDRAAARPCRRSACGSPSRSSSAS